VIISRLFASLCFFALFFSRCLLDDVNIIVSSRPRLKQALQHLPQVTTLPPPVTPSSVPRAQTKAAWLLGRSGNLWVLLHQGCSVCHKAILVGLLRLGHPRANHRRASDDSNEVLQNLGCSRPRQLDLVFSRSKSERCPFLAGTRTVSFATSRAPANRCKLFEGVSTPVILEQARMGWL